jgi:rubrerythrin
MYEDAANDSDDVEIKNIFESLKRDEDRHYKILDAEYCSITGIPQGSELGTYVRE